MKNFYLLLILALPMRVLAQPVIHYCDDYIAGDTITYVVCDSTGANPGSRGASQTWDLSSLTAASAGMDTLSQYFSATSTPPGSNVYEYEVSGSYPYTNFFFLNTDSGQTSILISGEPDVSHPIRQSLAKRPITYSDSFHSMFSTTGIYAGGGTVDIVADGYGTLLLPTGTFSNVLRVTQTIVENDSGVGLYTTVNYCWYDDAHVEPLCTISTVDFGGGPMIQSVIYLGHETVTIPPPSAVKNLTPVKQLAFSGNLTANSLVIRGNFEQDHLYKIGVTNLTGQKLYTSEFPGSSGIQSFDLGRDLSASVYLVSITDENNVASMGTIKVLKQ